MERLPELDAFCTFIPLKSLLSEWQNLKIEYPKQLIPEHAEAFEFSVYDIDWIEFYTNIAVKTVYDYGQARTEREKATDNFYGLLGEKAVKDKLRELRIIAHYNERIPQFFDQPFKEPFDFAVALKNGKYLTLEIKTVPEYPTHKHLLIAEREWKKSDYTIAVKMLKVEHEDKAELKIIGAFMGFMEKRELENLPIIEDEYPCPKYPCRAIELIKIPHAISELWEILNQQAIKWTE